MLCRHGAFNARNSQSDAWRTKTLALNKRGLGLNDRRAVGALPPTAARLPGAVLSAEKDAGGPKDLGEHGPKLLPRPVKPKRSTGGSGSGGGGSGRGPSGGAERSLASLAAYSGLVGTTAIVLANVSGIDLWGSFDFSSMEDLRLAAVASIPLQLINCALMLPSFSSPRLPELANLETMEANLRREQQQREEARRNQQAQATSTPSTPSASGATTTKTPSQSQAGSDTAAALTTQQAAAQPGSPPAASLEASAPGPSDRAAVADAAVQAQATATVAALTEPSQEPGAQAQSGRSEGLAAQQPPAGALSASSWGSGSSGSGNGEKKPGGMDWTGVCAALHLAQGYYISNNPTTRLTPAAEAAYSVVDTAAGEMLYRGVALTWLASWLQDRAYEAGIDETIAERLPAAAAALGGAEAQQLVSTIGVYGTCACAVSAATAAFVVWSVVSRSRRAAQRLEVLMRLGSGASSGRGAAAQGGDKAAGGGSKEGGGGGRVPTQVMFGPGAPSVEVSSAGAVMTRAAIIQAARDAAQVLLLNGLFIATSGNLAASFSAALANKLIFSALQRNGMRRMKERSAALAKELRAYNAQMQRIAAKYKDMLPQAAAARLDAMNEADAREAGEAVASSGSSSNTRINSSSSTSSAGDSAAGDRVAPALSPLRDAGGAEASGTLAASSAIAADDTTGSSSSSSGLPQGGVDGTAAISPAATTSSSTGPDAGSSKTSIRGLGGGRSSSLESALAMLDQLVPDPPKPAASGKLPKQQQQQQQQQQLL